MRPEITAHIGEILRRSHGMKTRVEVWRGGIRRDTFGDEGLPIRAGEVTLDATAKIRRTVSVEVPNTDSLWSLLTVPGTELRPYRAVTDSGRQTVYAWVPLGRMEVDTPRIGYHPQTGNLTVTGGDYWRKVQAAEFLVPGIAEFGTVIATQITTFLQQALPGVTIINTLTSPYYLGSKVWETDRAGAITEMVDALGAEVFFDALGRAVVQEIPQVSGTAVWTVDADSDTGVLLDASREQTLQRTRNVVVCTSTAVEGEPGFDPVIVWDTDLASPTYAGTDPLNNPGSAGPFGVRPDRLSSPLINTVEQAQQAATLRLGKVSGAGRKLSLTATVNPGLEPGDTIAVQLPRDVAGRRLLEAHIVDSVTVPLVPDAVQQIGTRAFGPAA